MYYRVANRDENVGFQDFIIDKTSFKKTEKQKEATQEKVNDTLNEDILGDSLNTKEDVQISPVSDPLAESVNSSPVSKTPEDTPPTQVPDWLAGNFSSDDTLDTPVKEVEETEPIVSQVLPEEVPLVEETTQAPEEEKQNPDTKKEIEENYATPETQELAVDETQIEESHIPDWLKQDFGTIDEAEKKPV